jgi:hypothetical protein
MHESPFWAATNAQTTGTKILLFSFLTAMAHFVQRPKFVYSVADLIGRLEARV